MYLDVGTLVAIMIALVISIFTMSLSVARAIYLEKQYKNKIYKLKTEIRQLKDSYR